MVEGPTREIGVLGVSAKQEEAGTGLIARCVVALLLFSVEYTGSFYVIWQLLESLCRNLPTPSSIA